MISVLQLRFDISSKIPTYTEKYPRAPLPLVAISAPEGLAMTTDVSWVAPVAFPIDGISWSLSI